MIIWIKLMLTGAILAVVARGIIDRSDDNMVNLFKVAQVIGLFVGAVLAVVGALGAIWSS